MREINKWVVERVCLARPTANRSIDQVHMKPESIIKQLDHLKNYIHGKDVMLLGDDDFLSIPMTMFLEPKSVTVFDIDTRILEALKNQNKKFNLNVQINFYNALMDVPEQYKGKYDFFVTNPPYGSLNKGQSGCFFINRCLEFCKEDISGCFILPYDKNLPWSLEAMHNVQGFLNKRGCVVKEAKHSIHNYYHEDKNLTSSSFIIDRIKNTNYKSDFGGIELY